MTDVSLRAWLQPNPKFPVYPKINVKGNPSELFSFVMRQKINTEQSRKTGDSQPKNEDKWEAVGMRCKLANKSNRDVTSSVYERIRTVITIFEIMSATNLSALEKKKKLKCKEEKCRWFPPLPQAL